MSSTRTRSTRVISKNVKSDDESIENESSVANKGRRCSTRMAKTSESEGIGTPKKNVKETEMENSKTLSASRRSSSRLTKAADLKGSEENLSQIVTRRSSSRLSQVSEMAGSVESLASVGLKENRRYSSRLNKICDNEDNTGNLTPTRRRSSSRLSQISEAESMENISNIGTRRYGTRSKKTAEPEIEGTRSSSRLSMTSEIGSNENLVIGDSPRLDVIEEENSQQDEDLESKRRSSRRLSQKIVSDSQESADSDLLATPKLKERKRLSSRISKFSDLEDIKEVVEENSTGRRQSTRLHKNSETSSVDEKPVTIRSRKSIAASTLDTISDDEEETETVTSPSKALGEAGKICENNASNDALDSELKDAHKFISPRSNKTDEGSKFDSSTSPRKSSTPKGRKSSSSSQSNESINCESSEKASNVIDLIHSEIHRESSSDSEENTTNKSGNVSNCESESGKGVEKEEKSKEKENRQSVDKSNSSLTKCVVEITDINSPKFSERRRSQTSEILSPKVDELNKSGQSLLGSISPVVTLKDCKIPEEHWKKDMLNKSNEIKDPALNPVVVLDDSSCALNREILSPKSSKKDKSPVKSAEKQNRVDDKIKETVSPLSSREKRLSSSAYKANDAKSPQKSTSTVSSTLTTKDDELTLNGLSDEKEEKENKLADENKKDKSFENAPLDSQDSSEVKNDDYSSLNVSVKSASSEGSCKKRKSIDLDCSTPNSKHSKTLSDSLTSSPNKSLNRKSRRSNEKTPEQPLLAEKQDDCIEKSLKNKGLNKIEASGKNECTIEDVTDKEIDLTVESVNEKDYSIVVDCDSDDPELLNLNFSDDSGSDVESIKFSPKRNDVINIICGNREENTDDLPCSPSKKLKINESPKKRNIDEVRKFNDSITDTNLSRKSIDSEKKKFLKKISNEADDDNCEFESRRKPLDFKSEKLLMSKKNETNDEGSDSSDDPIIIDDKESRKSVESKTKKSPKNEDDKKEESEDSDISNDDDIINKRKKSLDLLKKKCSPQKSRVEEKSKVETESEDDDSSDCAIIIDSKKRGQCIESKQEESPKCKETESEDSDTSNDAITIDGKESRQSVSEMKKLSKSKVETESGDSDSSDNDAQVNRKSVELKVKVKDSPKKIVDKEESDSSEESFDDDDLSTDCEAKKKIVEKPSVAEKTNSEDSSEDNESSNDETPTENIETSKKKRVSFTPETVKPKKTFSNKPTSELLADNAYVEKLTNYVNDYLESRQKLRNVSKLMNPKANKKRAKKNKEKEPDSLEQKSNLVKPSDKPIAKPNVKNSVEVKLEKPLKSALKGSSSSNEPSKTSKLNLESKKNLKSKTDASLTSNSSSLKKKAVHDLNDETSKKIKLSNKNVLSLPVKIDSEKIKSVEKHNSVKNEVSLVNQTAFGKNKSDKLNSEKTPSLLDQIASGKNKPDKKINAEKILKPSQNIIKGKNEKKVVVVDKKSNLADFSKTLEKGKSIKGNKVLKIQQKLLDQAAKKIGYNISDSTTSNNDFSFKKHNTLQNVKNNISLEGKQELKMKKLKKGKVLSTSWGKITVESKPQNSSIICEKKVADLANEWVIETTPKDAKKKKKKDSQVSKLAGEFKINETFQASSSKDTQLSKTNSSSSTSNLGKIAEPKTLFKKINHVQSDNRVSKSTKTAETSQKSDLFSKKNNPVSKLANSFETDNCPQNSNKSNSHLVANQSNEKKKKKKNKILKENVTSNDVMKNLVNSYLEKNKSSKTSTDLPRSHFTSQDIISESNENVASDEISEKRSTEVIKSGSEKVSNKVRKLGVEDVFKKYTSPKNKSTDRDSPFKLSLSERQQLINDEMLKKRKYLAELESKTSTPLKKFKHEMKQSNQVIPDASSNSASTSFFTGKFSTNQTNGDENRKKKKKKKKNKSFNPNSCESTDVLKDDFIPLSSSGHTKFKVAVVDKLLSGNAKNSHFKNSNLQRESLSREPVREILSYRDKMDKFGKGKPF